METKQENAQGPTKEQAIEYLRNYTNQRVMQHNATVHTLSNVIACLDTLPPDPDRDFIRADFERRLNELVGDAKGREARVTSVIFGYMKQFPAPKKEEAAEVGQIPSEQAEESTNEQQNEVAAAAASETETETVQETGEAKPDAAAGDESAGDVQAGSDEALDGQIDDIVSDEAAVAEELEKEQQ